MGLIRQVDDHLARLLATLERLGRLDDTLIFFTSDHGDFLGDHWLGEKEMFFEEAIRVPFIVVDPEAAADATRGKVDDRFVECVDVVPTILEALALPPERHLVEGRSLLALTRGTATHWRDQAISELDYSFRHARQVLNRHPRDCRAFMVRTEQWKYVDWLDYPPMLFNLRDDPSEQHDIGRDPGYASVRAEMRQRIQGWMERRKTRVTVADAYVEQRTNVHRKVGIHFGIW